MDDDLFRFEAPPEEAPQLILGKKKKKKKKKKDEPAIATEDAFESATNQLTNSHETTNDKPQDSSSLGADHQDSSFSALAEDGDVQPEPQQQEENNVEIESPSDGANIADSNPPETEEGRDQSDQLPPEPTRPMTAAEKKKAKKERERLAKLEKARKEKDELDAILAEIGDAKPAESAVSANGEESAPAEPLSAAQKKRMKKKKKATTEKAQAGEDIDALLAELEPAEEKPSADSIPDIAGAGGFDDLLAELGAGVDTSTAKKKAKKKKKKGASKATDQMGEGGPSDNAEVPVEPKKPKKKESAAVRKMREQRERQLAEEERLRKLQEEEEARIAEEERKREEEENRKAEEKAKKKAAEKAKRERKRQEGTLLSKAEKERRRKAEIFRKQMMERGMIPAASSSSQTQESSQRVIYGRKRKTARQKAEENEKPDDSQSKTQDVKLAEDVPREEEQHESGTKAQDDFIPESWDELPAEDAKTSEVAPTDTKAQERQQKDRLAAESETEDDDDESDADETDDSDYEGMSRAEVLAEKRVETLRKEREKKRTEALAARSPDHLRSPVICILGHVDTGKTKILDRIRRTNVQDGEAGGITQQIGATYFPIEAVKKEATKLEEGRVLDYNVPSLLIIDTPGHESFTNLRSRGSSLCDIAILVVDIMHGLEPQTRESIDLLKLRKTPFIVALNKIDRIYDWDPQPHNCPTRASLSKQASHASEEFYRRVNETKLEFAEIGFNTELYWKNDDPRKTVSLVPTSAISGEGIPDLLMLLLALPQRLLTERLMFNRMLEATVLEVKVIEGLGTTIDIILTGGTIHEGDTIMVVGLDGPILATIRALLTPHPMKEMRVKGQYLHHKKIEAAQGIKISADGLEKAVAGTQLMVVGNPNDEDEIEFVKEEVMKDFQTILTDVDRSGLGVYVQASTLGSLEALLEFLRTSKIKVSGINIGPVHKRDVTKASTMLEKRKEFATILAFDVNVEKEARELAEETGVRIFTADIIYHLFDQFTAYMEQMKKERREALNDEVVFPSICKILPQHIYNKKDPIVVGVDVMEGILRVGTPLVVRHGEGWLDVGRVASIELNKKQVVTARKGESVAVKIQSKTTEHIMYGRHFDFQDALISKMSRSAIELLKANFRDDLETEDWRLVVKLKKKFDII